MLGPLAFGGGERAPFGETGDDALQHGRSAADVALHDAAGARVLIVVIVLPLHGFHDERAGGVADGAVGVDGGELLEQLGVGGLYLKRERVHGVIRKIGFLCV